MRKYWFLLLAGGLLMTANLSSAPHRTSVSESGEDLLSKAPGIALSDMRKAASEDTSVSISKTYAQYGVDSEQRSCLRFATAVKGDLASITYTRTALDGSLEEKISPVQTIYRGIVSGDTTYYYNGENLTENKEEAGDFYWACYTIRFDTETYKSTDFNAFLTVENSAGETFSSSPRTASFTALQNKTETPMTLKGGVQSVENDMLFPESMIDTDGVVSENKYESSVSYCAEFPETLIGNYSVEFDVSDYKANANYPKLMVSFGGEYNNFYIVYEREGRTDFNRIESLTNAQSVSNEKKDGWINSDTFSEFDTSKTHHFKFVMDSGFYRVFLDGNELRFREDSNESLTLKPMRRYEDYFSPSHLRIATRNVSCRVSNLTVINGKESDIRNFYSYTDNVSETASGFDMKMQNAGWEGRDKYNVRTVCKTALPNQFTMKFRVTFSGNMTDSKLAVRIGNYEFHINNKMKNGAIDGQIFPDYWGTTVSKVQNSENPLTADVTIGRTADQYTFIINEKTIASCSVNNNTSSVLEFWGFNQEASENNIVASVTDLRIE